MILRNPLRLAIPKQFIQINQTRSISRDLLPPKLSKKPTGNPHRVPKTEGDAKLAAALVDFAQGPGAVFVPKDTIGLHLDFAKAQYGGHTGARKFALLNLPRMKFHNPHLDIKVFRRPWAGRAKQLKYPCTATILKYTGEKVTIDMRRKRSMDIYKEIMGAIRAEDLNGEFEELKQKAEVIAKPYLKWV